MKTVAHTLEQLDTTLDTVEELIRGLPLSIANENKCIDMLYAMWEMAEASVENTPLEVDTVAE
jgi:hypothetical protein